MTDSKHHDLRTRSAAWSHGRLYLWLFHRRCYGCSDPSFHTHHLTWLGRKRWTDV